MPTYELITRGVLHASETFAYSCAVTGSGTLSDAGTAAADANIAMHAASGFDACFDDGVLWSDVLVNQIPDGGGIVIDSTVVSSGDAGTSTAGSSPNQCAICVSKLTGFSGSRNRGRMFLPPPSVDSTTSAGRLDSTALTSLAAGITAWKNSLIGDGFTPVLVSTSQSANVVLTAFRVGDVVDTVRSRRNGLAEVYTTVAV